MVQFHGLGFWTEYKEEMEPSSSNHLSVPLTTDAMLPAAHRFANMSSPASSCEPQGMKSWRLDLGERGPSGVGMGRVSQPSFPP